MVWIHAPAPLYISGLANRIVRALAIPHARRTTPPMDGRNPRTGHVRAALQPPAVPGGLDPTNGAGGPPAVIRRIPQTGGFASPSSMSLPLCRGYYAQRPRNATRTESQ